MFGRLWELLGTAALRRGLVAFGGTIDGSDAAANARKEFGCANNLGSRRTAVTSYFSAPYISVAFASCLVWRLRLTQTVVSRCTSRGIPTHAGPSLAPPMRRSWDKHHALLHIRLTRPRNWPPSKLPGRRRHGSPWVLEAVAHPAKPRWTGPFMSVVNRFGRSRGTLASGEIDMASHRCRR